MHSRQQHKTEHGVHQGGRRDSPSSGRTFANRVELEQLKAAFDHIDDEGKGLLRPLQLKQLLLNIVQSSGGSQSDIYRILVSLDQRGNKPITFDEFVQLFAVGQTNAIIRGEQISRDEAMRLFRLIDVDNRGKIGYAELKRLIDDLGETITPVEIEEMIHRADINGDGLVDPDEFYRIISSRHNLNAKSSNS